ncbi:MAG: YciI family protein [Candidatus Binataceae bacterium]
MKFMLLMYNDQDAYDHLSKDQQDAAIDRLMKFTDELAAAGKLVITQGLSPRSEAVSIRLRKDGTKSITDGPFCETREIAGGYYVIEVASKQEALDWAKKLPLATWGVEVRRIHVE